MNRLNPISRLLFITFLLSGQCTAEQRYRWVELSPSSDSLAVYFKLADDKRNWAYGLSQLGDTHFLGDDTYTDESTGRSFDPSFTVISASKLWPIRATYSYADIGVGLGIGSGSWAENCERISSNIFSSRYNCEKREGTHLGLQLLASVAVGYRAGIGYAVDIFVHHKRTHAKLMMIFPIGRFSPKPIKRKRVYTLPML